MSVTIHRSFRIHPDDLAEIDKRARHYRQSRGQYIINAALQRLPDDTKPEDRLEALEHRIEHLERLAHLGTFE